MRAAVQAAGLAAELAELERQAATLADRRCIDRTVRRARRELARLERAAGIVPERRAQAT